MKGTSLFSSFEAKKLVDSYGASNQPIYFLNGTPTHLRELGSNTQPVYVNTDGVITPLTYTPNRLYYSEEATNYDQPSTNFIAAMHYASATKLAINSVLEPDRQLFVNGGARIALDSNAAISDQSLVIGLNSTDHLSIGNNGFQAYTNSDGPSILYLNPYGGNIQIGSATSGTIGTYYGRQIFKTLNGFSYEGIRESVGDQDGSIWFTEPAQPGIPVYNTQFKYNPYTGYLTLNNGPTEDSGIRSTNGRLSIQSASYLNLAYGPNTATIFSLNVTEVMRLNKFGKVIIGTGQEAADWQSTLLYVIGDAKVRDNLTAETITISSEASAAHLQFSRAGADNYIMVPLATEQTRLVIASDTNTPHYVWTESVYAPALDAASSLGTLNRKWSNIYLPTSGENVTYMLGFVSSDIVRSSITSTVHTLNFTSYSSINLGLTSGETPVGVTLGANSFYPQLPNQMKLGLDNHRWAGLYLGDKDLYGSNTNPIYWSDGLPRALTYTPGRLYYSASANSFEATTHYTNGVNIALGWFNDHGSEYDQDALFFVNGTSYLNGAITINGNIVPALDNKYNLGAKTDGHLAHVYIGTDDSYGSTINPIFWLNGVPTPSNETVGSATRPIFLNEGNITALSYVPNRLYYGVDTTSYVSSKHFINDRQVALNWYTTDETADYDEATTFYVNGTSYHAGLDTHSADIVPSDNDVYNLGVTTSRWKNGFFSAAVSIGDSRYVTPNSAYDGTYIAPGYIKLSTNGAATIDMNYGLTTAPYNTELTADAVGRLHIKYTANPAFLYNERNTTINLFNEGSFYSAGNIETSTQMRINGSAVGTGFYLDNKTIQYAKLYIDTIGTMGNSGHAILELGNNMTNTTDASCGHIKLYAVNEDYTEIRAQGGHGNQTFYLSDYAGTMYAAHTANNSAVGVNAEGTSQPIYISGSGRIEAITNAISTAYGGTGNIQFEGARIIYTSEATKLSSGTIVTNGSYLSNVSHINIGNNSNNMDTTSATAYKLYVIGTTYHDGDITVNGGSILNFKGQNQYIQWNTAADLVDNIRSFYGIGQASNKLYIANVSGIQVRTSTGALNLQAETGAVTINSTGSNITLTGGRLNDGDARASMVINTSREVLFTTAGHTSVRNNTFVIPDTNNKSGTVGTATKPVYVSAGVITACTYELKATVNNGTGTRLAYYSSDTAVSSGSIVTNGTYLRGIGGSTNASYALTTASFLCDSWVRTTDSTGWYNETYGGGWYMTDSTWIRSYGSKNIYQNTGILRTDGQFQVGDSGAYFYANNSGNGYFSNTLGIGGTNTGYKLYVNGRQYLAGNLEFADVSSTNSNSYKISWNGSTDGADIYYRVGTSDQGNLVLNTRDDTNCLIALAYSGTFKAYFNNSTPSFYPASNNSGSIGLSTNVWKDMYATNFHGALDGNATTATTLKTARTINGTSFNGSANITTTNWGTSRSVYIADSDSSHTGAAVSVNGGSDPTLKLPSTIKASLNGNADTASKFYTTGSTATLYLVGVSAYSSTYQVGYIYSPVYMSNGSLYATKVYNAVWNDYAEYREVETEEPGYCVTETKDGRMIKTTKRLQPGCKVTSDTFGNCMGETETAKTPIAVAGRVLVYPYRNRVHYQLGAAVCSAPDGTVDIMSREEIMTYPERIVGTVSEIPDYKIWKCGTNQEQEIEVKGRIWIYVR